MPRINATVKAFRTTQSGDYVVELNNGENHFIQAQLFPNGIEAGVGILYTAHKKDEKYPASFGKEGTFKKDGIHDVMVTKSATQANIEFKSKLKLVAEEV